MLLLSSGSVVGGLVLFLSVLLRNQLKHLYCRNDIAAVSSLLCLTCLIRKIPLMIENANQRCVLPATTGPRTLYNPLFINLMKVIVAFESLCDSISKWFSNSVLLDSGAGINQGWVFTCQNGPGVNDFFLGGMIILCFSFVHYNCQDKQCSGG